MSHNSPRVHYYGSRERYQLFPYLDLSPAPVHMSSLVEVYSRCIEGDKGRGAGGRGAGGGGAGGTGRCVKDSKTIFVSPGLPVFHEPTPTPAA